MDPATLNHTPKSYLTLSAVPDLLPDDAGAAAAIERELEAGGRDVVDRLIDYVWRDVITLDRDGRIAAQERWIREARDRQAACDPDRITESELRLLDGNR